METTRDINIFTIIAETIRRWKIILCCGIFCACLLCIWTIVKEGSTSEIPIANSEVEELRKQVDARTEEIADVERKISTIEGEYERMLQKYKRSNPLDMDPDKVYKAQLMYAIEYQGDIQENNELIVNEITAIALQIRNVIVPKAVNDATLEKGIDDVSFFNSYIECGGYYHIVWITTYGNSENEAIDLLRSICSHILSVVEKFNILDENFELTQTQMITSVGTNSTLQDMKNEIEITEHENTERISVLENEKKTRQEDMQPYVERLENLQASSYNEYNAGSTVNVKGIIKHTSLGFIVGIVGMMFVMAVLLILQDKVYTAKDVKCFTGLMVLGRISAHDKHGLDRLISKIEGKLICETDDKGYNLIYENIRALLKQEKRVLITGDLETSLLASYVKKISVVDSPIEYAAEGNIMNNGAAVNKMGEIRNVILVVECGKA